MPPCPEILLYLLKRKADAGLYSVHAKSVPCHFVNDAGVARLIEILALSRIDICKKRCGEKH
jgi:hypothetical protein